MIPMMIDPRRDEVQMCHRHLQNLATHSSIFVSIPISEHGATLFSLHVGSTGKYKFEFKINGINQLVLFNSVACPSIETDLGLQVPPDAVVEVICTNMDLCACDAYVSMRYSNIDLFAKFNEDFTKDLESKLEKI